MKLIYTVFKFDDIICVCIASVFLHMRTSGDDSGRPISLQHVHI